MACGSGTRAARSSWRRSIRWNHPRDAEQERYAAEHREGWGEFLDRLAVVLAEHQAT
jgi:hypothetical protein